MDGIEDRDPGAGSGRHDGGSLPEAEAERASVDPVFPDVKEGRRAGMLVLSLADRTSPESVAKVLDALRGSRDVEYAEPATPRKGVAVSRPRS